MRTKRRNTSFFTAAVFLFAMLQMPITKSEGTKNFMPTSSDFGNLEINDKHRPFAQESNTDSLYRLYIHIEDVSEVMYLGFNHQGNHNEVGTFRLKSPSGEVVIPRTIIPNSGAGYIQTYDEAVAGPMINGIPSGGYNAIQFMPDTIGDYYIEFTTNLGNTYHLDYFDITVTDSLAETLNGRLWAYSWDLSTQGGNNKYNGSFFIYTNDGFVTEVKMNNIQPYGFVIASNNFGLHNNPSDIQSNRKSNAGNFIAPQYKIFLNDPDSNIYPSGNISEVVEDLALLGLPEYGEDVYFTINMSELGMVELLIEINGIAGYQTNSEDVLLYVNVDGGLDTIVWDGKDGFGDFVEDNTFIQVFFSHFSSGNTNFLVFDAETHYNGFNVEKIRPLTGNANLYWDDSRFNFGTVNLDGATDSAHAFRKNFGNQRTINTWWNGFESSNISSFTMEYAEPLPVEFLSFDAISVETPRGASPQSRGASPQYAVELSWTTSTEINNDYFEIQRISNTVETRRASSLPLADDQWKSIATINGAGNSSTINNYQYTDNGIIEQSNHVSTPPVPRHTIYYRIKQIDFSGDYSYSEIRSVFITEQNRNAKSCDAAIYPNPLRSNGAITIEMEDNNEKTQVHIYTADGNLVYQKEVDSFYREQFSPELEKGIYIIRITTANNQKTSKISVI